MLILFFHLDFTPASMFISSFSENGLEVIPKTFSIHEMCSMFQKEDDSPQSPTSSKHAGAFHSCLHCSFLHIGVVSAHWSLLVTSCAKHHQNMRGDSSLSCLSIFLRRMLQVQGSTHAIYSFSLHTSTCHHPWTSGRSTFAQQFYTASRTALNIFSACLFSTPRCTFLDLVMFAHTFFGWSGTCFPWPLT